ncbi:MAG: hypothetical protein EHM19_09910 [Candidatus Latescibacterota bacterium]|nr:MAG: hypothetical protein EHM19_09910 [Candidatus Latescibacterota bacterium]
MRLITGLLVLSIFLLAASAVAEDKEKPWVEPFAPGLRALDCTGATPIGCGAVVQGSNVGAPNNASAYSCVGWNEGGGEVVYAFVVDQACQILTATLSGMTVDLDVFILSACDENECIAYGNAFATTTCLLPGTYYIVVDGYGTAQGGYTLTISCALCDCPEQACCPSLYHSDVFDFNADDNGFLTQICGGAQVWQWAGLANPEVPSVACDNVFVTNVLGTIVNGDYQASSGDIAVLGPVTITSFNWCMELCHYYDTESRFDGGNVKVSTDGGATWTLIAPQRGYDNVTYSACVCIPLESAFTGHQFAATWLRDCFNLSSYAGQQILVGFFFGSDSSVHYPGWYIKWVKFGGNQPTSNDESTWGEIKSMFR